MPFDFLKPKSKISQTQTQNIPRYSADSLLGDLFLRAGKITREQLDEAIKVSGTYQTHVGQNLVQFKYISPRDLQAAIDAQSFIRDRTIDQNMAIQCLKIAFKTGMTFPDVVQDQTGTPDIPSNKLGELLLESGLVGQEQFAKAMQKSLAIGLPLGRILVLSGALAEPILTMALELQVRIRDGMTTRDEALDLLVEACDGKRDSPLWPEIKRPRRKGLRLGELLVSAGFLNETDVMNALELGLANDQPIGQVLVSQGYISEDLLNAALTLQRRIDEDSLDAADAANALSKMRASGEDISAVLSELDRQQVEEAPNQPLTFEKMLTLARVVSQDDIESALSQATQSAQVLGKILNMTGFIDEFTMQAVQQCYTMLAGGFLTQDDAVVALDYCLHKEERVSFPEALAELGWNASLPMLVQGATSVDLSHVRLGLFSGEGPLEIEPNAPASAVEEVSQESASEQVDEVIHNFVEQVLQEGAEDEVELNAAPDNEQSGASANSWFATTKPQAESALDAIGVSPQGESAHRESDYSALTEKIEAQAESFEATVATTSENSTSAQSSAQEELPAFLDDLADKGDEPAAETAASTAHASTALPAKPAISMPRSAAADSQISSASLDNLRDLFSEAGTNGGGTSADADNSSSPSETNNNAAEVDEAALFGQLMSGASDSQSTLEPNALTTANQAAAANENANSELDSLFASETPPNQAEELTARQAELRGDQMKKSPREEETTGPIAAISDAVVAGRAGVTDGAAKALDPFWGEALASAAEPGQANLVSDSPSALHSVIIARLEQQVADAALSREQMGTSAKADLNLALGEALGRLSESYYEQGDYTKAQDLYERILLLKESQHGPKDAATGQALANVAGVLWVQGKYAEAEPYVQRVAGIIESDEPLDKARLADCLSTLAKIMFQQGKYIESEPVLQRALKLRQDEYGMEHADVADSLRDYAKLLRKLGRNADAEVTYARAKAILAKQARGAAAAPSA